MAKTAGREEWDALNRKLYAANPVTYFARRFDLLMLAGGRSAELDALLDEGVTFAGYQHRREREPSSNAEWGDIEYLVAESQSLYHQASETLIRLFLAHWEMPGCPWIEMASLRSFADFKSRVAELKESVWQPEMEASVFPIFLGTTPRNMAVDGHKRAIVRLIRILAANLLNDANLYNAVKHGMAVQAGSSSFSIGDADGSNARTMLDGPSIVYLESDGTDTGRTWHETTNWIDFRRTVWFTDLAIREIAALWLIARARYTECGVSSVPTINEQDIDSGLSNAAIRGSFRRVIGHEIKVETASKRKGRSGRRDSDGPKG